MKKCFFNKDTFKNFRLTLVSLTIAFIIFLPQLPFAQEVITISEVKENGAIILSDGNKVRLSSVVIDNAFASEAISIIKEIEGSSPKITYINKGLKRNGESMVYIVELYGVKPIWTKVVY